MQTHQLHAIEATQPLHGHSSDVDFVSEYETNGLFFDHELFSEDELNRFETALARMLDLDDGQDTLGALRSLEKSEPGRFYQVCTRELWFTVAGLRLITSERLLAKAATLLDCHESELSPVGHSLFWNDPECERLHYQWHQEAAYYPDMKHVVSAWFPLLYDLSESSGPMIAALESHHERLEFNRHKQEGGVTQMEISEEVLSRYDLVSCALPRKAGVIFHQNTVHKTGDNLTDKPRLSGIIRYANLKAEKKTACYWNINPEF